MDRTPSLYSQDDPISVALRPPQFESDQDRQSRLQQEREARRISEQIDEELRLERERLKKSKNDVKVSCSPPHSDRILPHSTRIYPALPRQLLLLGQAESGKSTLQKQFQLMYRPHSLESERSSWRTVVYFNVVHSLKHILATLEMWGDSFDGSDAERVSSSNDIPSLTAITPADVGSTLSLSSAGHSSNNSHHPPSNHSSNQSQSPKKSSKESLRYQIANLRRRLSPLVAADTQLADRLSDGVTVSGSGKGGVYVRSGWQARTVQYGFSGKRTHMNYNAEAKTPLDSSTLREDPLVDDVGQMLDSLQQDIFELWNHPTVRTLIAKRKLQLDEWEELWVAPINRSIDCALTHARQFPSRHRTHRLAWLYTYNWHVHLTSLCPS